MSRKQNLLLFSLFLLAIFNCCCADYEKEEEEEKISLGDILAYLLSDDALELLAGVWHGLKGAIGGYVQEEDNRAELLKRLPSDCGRAPRSSFDPYISGGFDANKGDYPSYVLVKAFDYLESLTCGGTLISDRHILTAAHCFKWANRASVSLGAMSLEDEFRFPVDAKKICRSPKYNISARPSHRAHHDLALITLDKPIAEFNESVQPACLPNAPIATKKILRAVGLGYTQVRHHEGGRDIVRPSILQVLPVKLTKCKPKDLHHSKVCLVNSDQKYVGDTCSGDSGGPIYGFERGKMTLVATTSYGPKTCQAGEPGVSVNVDIYNTLQEIGQLIKLCG